jgi:hypothetical protein
MPLGYIGKASNRDEDILNRLCVDVLRIENVMVK